MTRGKERAPMHGRRLRGLGSIAAAQGLCLGLGLGQTSQGTAYIPPPDPGYALYYYGDLGLREGATRWGYHDGWKQGRQARNRRRGADATGCQDYKTAPRHGDKSGIDGEQYQRAYRSAFVRGYEHGFRL